jgi:hypothetical protein
MQTCDEIIALSVYAAEIESGPGSMGKAGRWLKSFLSGKKDNRPPQDEATPVLALPPPTPKEKRWSFRRPVPAGKSAAETPATEGRGGVSADVELEQKKHGVATAAVARLSCRRASLPASLDAAAVRIQATFRGYLVRSTHFFSLRGISRHCARGTIIHGLALRGAGEDGSARAARHREAASSGARATGAEAGERHPPPHAGAPRRAGPAAGAAHARPPGTAPPAASATVSAAPGAPPVLRKRASWIPRRLAACPSYHSHRAA